MRKNNRIVKQRARLIAMTMALALTVPQVVVPVSDAKTVASLEADTVAEATTGSAADVEELRTLIRANLVADYDLEKDGGMYIDHQVRNNNASDALTVAAQNVKAQKGIKSAKYALYDINKDGDKEMIIRYNAKKKNTVRIYSYDTYDLSTEILGEAFGVSEIRKNTKKKQLVIVTTTGKKIKTITPYTITASGKLKAGVTYKKNGKTYKKGKKKIKKKAFDKYYKTVKKLAAVKLGAIPKEDYSYEDQDECFYGKGIFWRSVEDETGRESFFMTHADDVPAQDKYLAYWYAYDCVGWHEYTVEPALLRYVLGPDVVDPKTGKTYQQEDWEAMSEDVFGGQFAPPFLTETYDEAGNPVLDIEADGPLQSVEVAAKQAVNGAQTYQGKEFTIIYGDAQLRMVFIDEGALKGRITEAGMFFPNVSGDIDHEKWVFQYGDEAGNPAEHDQLVYDLITAGGVTEGAETRTLQVNAASDDLKQTIKAGASVAFALYSGPNGQFYTTSADGKETLLPLLPKQEEDGDGVTVSDDVEAWIEFEKALNPPNGQLSYADPAADYLFWRVK
ncbi:MAG: hypothetical protein VZQ83_08815 [Eubacterium sp.]|nr:hypothetical protein [Eubacterium sp.]